MHGARGATARARETSTTPPSTTRSAHCPPLRERHCRRPRLPPRRGTTQAPSRDQGHPGGAHGRKNDPIASPCHGMRCPPVHPLVASWPWLLHTGCSLEAMDITGPSGIMRGDTVGLSAAMRQRIALFECCSPICWACDAGARVCTSCGRVPDGGTHVPRRAVRTAQRV